MVKVKSDSTQLILSINDPRGAQVANEMGQQKMEAKFDVVNGGQYQICLRNQERRSVKVLVDLHTGEWSNKFVEGANTITTKALKPVELHALQLNEMIGRLRREMGDLVASEVELDAQNTRIRSRVFVFGVISVLIMGLSTYLQVNYLKNFFRLKKII